MLPALSFFVLAGSVFCADDLAAKSERAKTLMAVGRFAEAVPIYKELVSAVPGNPGLLLNLGMAEHMAGNEKEAIPILEAVLKLQPRSMPALMSLGAARLALREPALAIGPLQKAVAAEPENPDARGMLADALNGAEQFDAAAGQYRKLTDLAPNDPRAWYGLGMTYQSVATSAFERLQKLNGKSPFVAALIADTRVQRRQYRSAFYFYSEALKQLPGTHGIHAALAEVYRKTGHSDWAAAEDAKESALAPADCAAHGAECQFLAGHDLQAAALPRTAAPSPEALYWRAKAANELALQSLVRLGQLPPSMELHQLRAEIARDQNQHLESVKEWRAALELAPGNPRLRHELAVSYFLAADYKMALAETEKVLREDPRSPEMNFTAGDSWLRLEEPEKAVPYLRAALAADPKMRAADASLGLSLSRLGKFAEAIPHLERAQELDDDGSLHYQLARAYQAAGNAVRAQAAMAQYQELQKRNQAQKEEAARETQIVPPQ
ncbi:MAG: tetratricopeptide repeat protein [Acidobacteriota bacterium]